MTFLYVALYFFIGMLVVKAINRFDREYPLQISFDNEIDTLMILVILMFWPAVLLFFAITGSMILFGWVLSKLKIIAFFNKVIK